MILMMGGISAQVNSRDHYVKGYYRSDGTYVKGHYRSNPNHTLRDNFSTKGNINPYTGKEGWIDPDARTVKYFSSTPKTPPVQVLKVSETRHKVRYQNWTVLINFCKNCANKEELRSDLTYFSYYPGKGVEVEQGKLGRHPLHGEHLLYDRNGQLWIKCSFNRGVLHGDATFYDSESDFHEDYHFKNGTPVYSKSFYSEDTVLEVFGDIQEPGCSLVFSSPSGKIHKLMEEQTGGRTLVKLFQDRRMDMEYTTDRNGDMIDTVKFLNKEYDSYDVYFLEDGRPTYGRFKTTSGNIAEVRGDIYNYSTPGTLYEEYTPEGQRVSTLLTNKDGTASTVHYDHEGRISWSTTMRMRDSVLHGPYKEFHTNGNLKVEGEYDHGMKNGRWVYYDIDGESAVAFQYRIRETFHEDGKPKTIFRQIYNQNSEEWVNHGMFYSFTNEKTTEPCSIEVYEFGDVIESFGDCDD